LVEKFGGVTIDNSPQMGSWINYQENKLYAEPMMEYWVICENNAENIEFLTKLKQKITSEFIQTEVLIFYGIIYKL
jgi:hypothetical protein